MFSDSFVVIDCKGAQSPEQMIHRIQMTFTAWGENFKPSKLSAPFTEAHDPGAIGRYGRYRGMPTPYGSGDICAPEAEPDPIAYLHREVVPRLPSLREAGATQFWLRMTYNADSGAIGFSREEIRMLAEMECDVPIDCMIEEESATETGPTPTDESTPLRPLAQSRKAPVTAGTLVLHGRARSLGSNTPRKSEDSVGASGSMTCT